MPPEQPWGQQTIFYHGREDRRMVDQMPIQPGVIDTDDLKPQPGTGLNLSVGAGSAWVRGSHAGVTRQGLYKTTLASTENPAATVGTAHATLPRIDQLVLRIKDTQPAPGTGADATSEAVFEVVPGTATAGATLANRNGAAATLPVSSLRLIDILVPAAFTGPFVAATHFRDRRPWAHGAYNRQSYTAGFFAFGGAGAGFAKTLFDLPLEITNTEADGSSWGLVEMYAHIGLSGTAAAGWARSYPQMDGAKAYINPTSQLTEYHIAITNNGWAHHEWHLTLAVPVGWHTFSVGAYADVTAWGYTGGLQYPSEFLVREPAVHTSWNGY